MVLKQAIYFYNVGYIPLTQLMLLVNYIFMDIFTARLIKTDVPRSPALFTGSKKLQET